MGHVPLNDQTATYVRGTGTNALDANLNLAGIQTNGVGMQRTLAPTSVAHVFSLIDGQLYNLQSSATAVFRNSIVVTGANVATGLDPQNPNRIPVQPFPESIVPRYEDWGGPDNTVSSKFHAYTLEFKHAFSDRISLLLAHNAQKDDAFTISPFNKAAGLGANSHAVFIDVNPNLPDPRDPTRTRLIPNPRFEQYFVNLSPITLISGHDMQNWRGLFVVDPELPWGITQRVVLSAGYRHEAFYADAFNRSLSREEILRRGYTAKEALYPNNEMFYFHYLNDGNGEDALRNSPIPGVTTDYRSTIGGGNKRFDQSLTSGSANMVGSYFKGAVHTSLGLSRDHWIQSSAAPLQVDAATGEQRFVDTAGNLIPNRDLAKVDVPLIPFSDQWVTNQSYGAVWRALPWVSFTAGYFESALFSDNFGIDLNGGPLAPQTGEGHDYSVRFHPLGDRINANFTYFETVSKNNSAKISTDARDELNLLISKPFVNTTDYRDRTSTGYEVEIVTNVTRQWTLRGAYGRNRTIDTRFFPLLEAKISEARATAKAKGLNPDDATQISRELLASQEDAAQGTNRSTAALTTRYSFVDGMLKGAAVGGSVRYIQGQARGGVTVGGVQLLPDTQTESSYVVSPFVSYRRRIGRVSWTAQVNVNNVFDKVTEQGISYSFPRYTNPRQIITTVSMAF